MMQLLKKLLGPIYASFAMLNICFTKIPEWLIALAVRLVIFRVFWLSVQTKIVGWTIAGQHFKFWELTDAVFFQFWEYPAPLNSDFMIYAGTFAEFFLAIAILLGLFTRYAATGLLAVTLVIQFVEPTGWWSAHVYWVILLVYLVRQGGGLVSVDRLIARR